MTAPHDSSETKPTSSQPATDPTPQKPLGELLVEALAAANNTDPNEWTREHDEALAKIQPATSGPLVPLPELNPDGSLKRRDQSGES